METKGKNTSVDLPTIRQPQYCTFEGYNAVSLPPAIDPFSFPNDTVVHYLVNKDDIIKLAQDYNGNHTKNVATTEGTGTGVGGAHESENTTGLMNFALTPFTGVTQISTSSDIPTNTGSIHAALSWSPNPIVPNTQSTLHISFYDPTGTAPLTNTISCTMIWYYVQCAKLAS